MRGIAEYDELMNNDNLPLTMIPQDESSSSEASVDMERVARLLKWSKSRYLVEETTKDKHREIREALTYSQHSEYPLYKAGGNSSDESELEGRGSPF